MSDQLSQDQLTARNFIEKYDCCSRGAATLTVQQMSEEEIAQVNRLSTDAFEIAQQGVRAILAKSGLRRAEAAAKAAGLDREEATTEKQAEEAAAVVTPPASDAAAAPQDEAPQAPGEAPQAPAQPAE